MAPSRPTKRSKISSSGGRSRSFGGCATCRMRHMKCDEGKPTCLMCKHFGLSCSGYEKNIFFTSEEDDRVERFRRPLFTEEERQEMSLSLVYSVPGNVTLINVLSQLDEECEGAESNTADIPRELSLSRGPFGAFKITKQRIAQDALLFEDSGTAQASFESVDVAFSPAAFTFSPGTQEMFETFLQQADGSDDTTVEIEPTRIEDLFLESLSPINNGQLSSPLGYPACDSGDLILKNTSTHSLSPTSIAGNETVPESAVYLLKHYSTSIIGMLTPSRNSKTPWHILFLPHVKNSLAALSMGESLDHASLSAFYGTLAISAFHLEASSRFEDWYEKGSLYKQKAREHIRLALRTAYNIPKVAKYKSILIALLTMVQVSMYNGDWKQTECYLLEAEKFIRLRGLHRKKSRKRRLLHHCYSFIRILHESLFATATHSLQRIHVQLAVESSGLVIRGQDSPLFKLSSWGNFIEKMNKVKDHEEGENDLHLEYPGLFNATMYPEIYGLPEEWLVMLSQVIRLGNEKETHSDSEAHLSLKEFSRRAKDLEQYIIKWDLPATNTVASSGEADDVNQSVMIPLLDALHQALIVYFYRRIYDVDASMLQKQVERIRDSLRQCDEADSGRIRYTPAFVWPAFISACEAQDPALQEYFNVWFQDCVTQSGQSLFKYMYSTVKQVWHERSQNQNSGVSWLDYVKDSSVIGLH